MIRTTRPRSSSMVGGYRVAEPAERRLVTYAIATQLGAMFLPADITGG
ncbi:hypothetical protein [Nocardia coubleae]|uniref:Uncharacterized protein n=1 Tax=Nocardia coubleae TaxID=356147 RepID=A0A846W6B2_9NOCA|nr:hypothetical protein [Nocardia coubleae]NKX88615.1 hypothetical protein [Nocardia coubleae]